MFRLLRLLLAAGVLLAASLGGCLLSAAQLAEVPMPAPWLVEGKSFVQHPWFGNLAMIFGGFGIAMISLTIYAVRLRRSAARLRIDHAANQLLIDALDKMRAAIAIFDKDMKAVHWNSGLETRFPEMAQVLGKGATVAQTCRYFYQNGIFASDMDSAAIEEFASTTAKALQSGRAIQRIVHTPTGSTFDLGMFQLGLRHFGAIWVDVTELHLQQERIASQRSELERKNRQLLGFSTMAAHDLKAPLLQQTALLEFIQEDIADAGIELTEAVTDQFAMLSDLSRRMTLLVSDLLGYATADSAQPPAERIVPDTRLWDVVALAAPRPGLRVVIAPEMPAVMVEPHSFDMVFRNLINNAAKHHDKPSGRIALRAFREHDQVVVEVEDDGPGIPAEQRDHVFEPFVRLTSVEGTGLGLALVKKTVEAWGGAICLRAAPVRGCIFSVRLPAAPDPPHPDLIRVVAARGSAAQVAVVGD